MHRVRVVLQHLMVWHGVPCHLLHARQAAHRAWGHGHLAQQPRLHGIEKDLWQSRAFVQPASGNANTTDLNEGRPVQVPRGDVTPRRRARRREVAAGAQAAAATSGTARARRPSFDVARAGMTYAARRQGAFTNAPCRLARGVVRSGRELFQPRPVGEPVLGERGDERLARKGAVGRVDHQHAVGW